MLRAKEVITDGSAGTEEYEMSGTVKMKTFLIVLISLGVLSLGAGIYYSILEVRRINRCTVNVTAKFESSERTYSGGRSHTPYEDVTYEFTYNGHTGYCYKSYSYPDVVPIPKEVELTIDPENIMNYVYKNKRYDDVFNSFDLIGVLLLGSAGFFFWISRVQFKSYI